MSKELEISQILGKWCKIKEEIATLERKKEQYRTHINNYMRHREKSKINVGGYAVTRRRNVRESVTKKDIPPELWNKVCNKSVYYSLIVKKE